MGLMRPDPGHMFAGHHLRRRSGMLGGVQALFALLVVVLLLAHRQPADSSGAERAPAGANATDPAAHSSGCLSGASMGSESHSSTDAEAPGERFLSFEVCGDWAVQRVALLSGMAVAAETNRTAVLPQLLLDGRTFEFGKILDQDIFIAGMRKRGMQIAALPPADTDTVQLNLAVPFDAVRSLQLTHASVQHVRLSCPAFQVPPELIAKHEQLVFAASQAMQLRQPLVKLMLRAQQHLRELSATNEYNVLHLRAEESWPQECERWDRSHYGRPVDNCLNNTASVGESLLAHGVNSQVPLLVLRGPGLVNRDLLAGAIRSLEGKGYKIALWGDIPGMGSSKSPLIPEAAALIQFYLALGAHQFVGNSVALPDALLIMERRHEGRFAAYYNGGHIPLEAYLPLFQVPWVFTYNDWSVGTEYEHMVKAAVTSAIEVAHMKPFCLFTGSAYSTTYQWLASRGVTMIQHTPAWKDELIQESMTGSMRAEDKQIFSHLYADKDSIVATFLRIDIPKLAALEQYNFVLFTDCDVYFRKRMKLVDWGTLLPTAIGMGYELQNTFPYNVGVSLWNLPYMRKTNDAFINWILSQHNGLHYGLYSSLDQGALNQYYEDDIKGHPISRKFNAMIYYRFRDDARIVHLHGPKPSHYLEFMRTGNCRFGSLCKLGVMGGVASSGTGGGGGFCDYLAEYQAFAPEWQEVQDAHRMCAELAAKGGHAPVAHA